MSLSAEDKIKLSRFLKSPIMNDQSHELKNGFKNFMSTQTKHDAMVIDIENKMALHTFMCVIQALNKNKKPEERIIVRVAAGGRKNIAHSASYSATSCAIADVVLHLTGNEFTNISRMKNSNVVRVGASVQIGELDKELYHKHHLSLPTSSLIPYVTVGGLASTGGHGTGKDQPSFAGLVRGITLCLENGEEVYIDHTHPDFATIAGANNGLFGVVISMDIECMPAKKMECVMEKRSPIEFIEEVNKGLFNNDDYVSVMYVPTYRTDELTNRMLNNVIVYRWRPVSLESPNLNHEEFLSELAQAAEIKLDEAIRIPEILRTYPKLIPFYMRHITAPLSIGEKDQLAVGPWHEMMHYRTSFPQDLDEICGIFPVKDQPEHAVQGTEIVKAFEQAITLLAEHAKRGEYPVSYGMYFRFLQGTNGGLSFTSHPEGHHVCAMDLTSNERLPGFAEFKQEMQNFFLNEMNAKFHWGKNAPADLDYAKLYGQAWQDTKHVLETWHHKNHISTVKSTLLNPMFSQVLGYPQPALISSQRTQLQYVADSHVTAAQAKKMISVIGDKSAECQQIQAEIEADLKKKTASNQTLFAAIASDKSVSATVKKEDSKQSSCCIL
jgi:hypothetical protein